ncbi:MAG: 7TM diverse intracellular signaling domain-containing protein [Massilia sp.]
MRILMLLALAMHLLLASGAAAATGVPVIPLGQAGSFDLLPHAVLLRDEGGDFPASAADLDGWLRARHAVGAVASSGGSYWLVTRVRNDSALADWVIYPNNTLIDRVETRLYGDATTGGGPLLAAPRFTGYLPSHDYMLHYGSDLRLESGRAYLLVVRFTSPYFVRDPIVSLRPQAAFRTLVARENVLILGCLGALAALALYNFFIFLTARRRAYLHYSLFVLCTALAWAMPFNVFADLLGWRLAKLHYVPFFLMPVFSTLFYLRFLELKTRAPRLAALSRINIVLPLLLLPTSFLAIGVAHKLATLAISFYMVLALLSGIVAWRRGFKPARYFVLAYIAVLAPALLVLPANLGLLPPVDFNVPLLVLVGGTVDAVLLAFALADQIRLLGDSMEAQVAARTNDLLRANAALTAAKEHAEVVSRHRIDFLSAMSHDIRTPMAGIIGMLKLGLRDPAVQGRTEEYLRIGLRSGESLLVILNDILDYSKIDAGKLTLETTSFDLGRLIADAIAILRGQAEAKGLMLRAAFEDALPRYVVGDPTRIRQILVNLLGNAIKFTDSGEVLLSVRMTAGGAGSEGSGGQQQLSFMFSVHDTGPGIAADVQGRLFQKFEQGDYSTTRRYGGTGLGLAICKELAGLMGGSISVASTPGVGSRFDVTVPLTVPDTVPDTVPLSAPDSAAGALAHSRRLTILCAEDVGTNQIIIRALLEAMGHQVVIVENGADALQSLADPAREFDLVLMDGRMPLMDGSQATRLIRAGRSDTGLVLRNPRIPIIALTANASQIDCERYLAAGMDGFLSKPVDEAALHAVIERTIAALDQGRSPDAAPARRIPDGAGAPAAAAIEEAEEVRLAPVRGLSAIQMGRIASAFLAEGPRRLADAREALAAGRHGAAADALHALKGSAGYLTSPRLQQIAARLEARALAGALSVADPELAALEAALNAALAGVRAAATADSLL